MKKIVDDYDKIIRKERKKLPEVMRDLFKKDRKTYFRLKKVLKKEVIKCKKHTK